MSQEKMLLKDAEISQHSSAPGFLANLIALEENVKRLTMNVTSGHSLKTCFAKLDLDGSWVKTCGGYSQVRMDDFSGEYLETWPLWGIQQGGDVMELIGLEQFIKENEFSLFPNPMASDGMSWTKNCKTDVQTSIHKCWKHGGTIRSTYYLIWGGLFSNPSRGIQRNDNGISEKFHGFRLGGIKNEEGNSKKSVSTYFPCTRMCEMWKDGREDGEASPGHRKQANGDYCPLSKMPFVGRPNYWEAENEKTNTVHDMRKIIFTIPQQEKQDVQQRVFECARKKECVQKMAFNEGINRLKCLGNAVVPQQAYPIFKAIAEIEA